MSRLRKCRTSWPLVDALDAADREATDSHRAIAAAIRDDVEDIILITVKGACDSAREARRLLVEDVL